MNDLTVLSGTPRDAGYAMPAEWAEHERCFMAWPCRPDTWANSDGTIDEAREAYAEVARAISRFEPVTMLCRQEDVADASMECGSGIDILPVDLDDSWTRDSGPTFVAHPDGRIAAVDWTFNGWGGLIGEGYKQDALLVRALGDKFGWQIFDAPVVTEGGAIHTDGEGTLLAVESCIVNDNRNPGRSRDELEAILLAYTGAEKMIWLGEGYEEDETGGHIDNFACFVAPAKVMLNMPASEDDPNFPIAQDALSRLLRSEDARGRQFEVIQMPQPKPVFEKGRRLALSYINFYIANHGIIMPAFDQASDAEAAKLVQAAFPEHEIVQVQALPIVRGGGGIHCITQQQPKWPLDKA
jgi:agmatine deiminase